MQAINSIGALGIQQQTPTTGNPDLGQEEYLKLMITQFQNQDPFKPMENGDFLGQIAQFGTVSGISELKESFGAVAASISSDQTLQASGLIGRSILANVNTSRLPEGGAISGAVDLPTPTTGVTVEVRDSSGQLVRHFEVGAHNAGFADFTWDGVTDQGVVAPAGSYTFEAQMRTPAGPEAVAVMTAAEVQSVSISPHTGALSLNFSNLDSLGLHQILQIH